jgi:hypothetical protein
MTDIEAAERVLAQLSDQKDRASEQVKKMSAERQAWAYSAHVDGSEQAKTKLAALNKSMAETATTIESLDASLVEAKKRLAVARDAVARDVEKEHARNALATLEDLMALAPRLDELVKHPRPEDGREFYCQNDPPTCCAAAKLMAVLVNEHLCALKLTEATFPKHWHGAANKMDLEKEIMRTISAGWPRIAVEVAPRQRTSGHAWPAPARTPEFTKILNGWAAVIRKSLVQYEQMNREEAHAA